MAREKIILYDNHAPGDVLMMTSLVRDIVRAYPNRYELGVETPCPDIWKFSPHLTLTAKEHSKVAKTIKLDYGKHMPKRNRGMGSHFIRAFHDSFKYKTGVYVPLTEPVGEFHFPADEPKLELDLPPRYWVIMAGGKSDFITKHWMYAGSQIVSDTLRSMGIPVVQAGAARAGRITDIHAPIRSTLNLIGKTKTLRQFIQLIHGADGVICPVTFAMHACAAMGKPCVVTAGNREEWWWEGYHRDNPGLQPVGDKLKVNHRYLHSFGSYLCDPKFKDKGCWKSGVIPSHNKKSFCARPMSLPGQTVPECMTKITPQKVIESVLSYYYDRTLPPIPGSTATMIPDVSQPISFKLDNGRIAHVRVEFETPSDKRPPMHALPVVPTQPAPEVDEIVLATPIVETPTITVAQPSIIEVKPPMVDTPVEAGLDTSVTVCSLLYGDYADMHAKHLASLIPAVTGYKLDFRVFCNSVGRTTRHLVDQYRDSHAIRTVYNSDRNINKYPAMRQMFHDSENPIKTRWVLWLDDDTLVNVYKDWFPDLMKFTTQRLSSDAQLGMVGVKQVYHRLTPARASWVRQASWYQRRPFRDQRGRPGPGNNCINFLVGAFWLMRTDVIKAAHIPDPRLDHNGGDIAIGEAIYQSGFTMQEWSPDKSKVNWSASKRRGTDQQIFNIKG